MSTDELINICSTCASMVIRRFKYDRRLCADELTNIAFCSIVCQPDYSKIDKQRVFSIAYLTILRHAYRELQRPCGFNYGPENSGMTVEDMCYRELRRVENTSSERDIDLLLDIHEAMDRLDDSDRRLLHDYFTSCLSYKDMAEKRNITPQSVFVRVQSALDILRFTLRSYK